MSTTHPRRLIAFDVFGTLVDPGGLEPALHAHVGDAAGAFAAEWRRTQVEYLLRRAAMGVYAPFRTVTAAALADTAVRFDVTLAPAARDELVAAWFRLPAKPDAAEALDALARGGQRLVAFSNGAPDDVDGLLRHAGLRAALTAVLGVEGAGTYKPAPVVYHHLVAAGGQTAEHTWLVSANYWDALGACAAGLRSAWIAAGRPAESWEWTADVHVDSLRELAGHPALAR